MTPSCRRSSLPRATVFLRKTPIIDARGVRLIVRLDGSATVRMPQLRRRLGEGKAPSRSFRKKKTEPMSPTLVRHFRYSRCDPPHERFAVDVPFAFATSCFRQGHRRYAPRTCRREMHRDCWRTRGTSARSRLPIQLTEDSSSIIPHSSTAGNQKPSRRCERPETA